MPATTIPSSTHDSDAIQSHLMTVSGLFSSEIIEYSIAKNPWSKLLPRGDYRKGMGDKPRVLVAQRALVGTSDGRGTWATHSRHGQSTAPLGSSPPDISDTRGNPPVNVVQARTIPKTFERVWGEVQSPLYDVRDFSFDWEFEAQLEIMVTKYTEAAARMWDYKQEDTYIGLCENGVIPGVPESGSLNALANLRVVSPTSLDGFTGYTAAQLNMTGALPSGGYSTNHSVLGWGIMAEIRAQMDRDGAGDKKGMQGGEGSVYPLVCSTEQMYWMMREPGTRDDIRHDDSSDLLRGLGYKKAYNGWTFMPNTEVPRFTLALNGSTYDFTKVPAYTYQSGALSTTFAAAEAVTGNSTLTKLTTVPDTSGMLPGSVIRIAPTSASDDEYSGEFEVHSYVENVSVTIKKAWTDTATGVIYNNTNGEAGWVKNSSYANAPYEMSIVLHPDVVEILIPHYPDSLANGMEFDANFSIGDFKWMNIQNNSYNRHKSFGFWDGVMEFAPRPGHTEYGWYIIHRRASSVVLASPSFAIGTGLGLWS